MRDYLVRQSFLGPQSDARLESARVAIVGLGGGGSHVVQQLAHVGVGNFTLFDHDRIEPSNLNRLVGGTLADSHHRKLKTAIARRAIRRVNPSAKVTAFANDWRTHAQHLRDCDIIIGCVDSYLTRSELEAAARRYLIPYIDIGIDVHKLGGDFLVSGQVILSMPGERCMRCIGFLNDVVLKAEAELYGAAGGRPQVVWPNGVLASTAVGLAVQYLTPWHPGPRGTVYIEYDGNASTLESSNRLKLAPSACRHFHGVDSVGDPWYSKLGC